MDVVHLIRVTALPKDVQGTLSVKIMDLNEWALSDSKANRFIWIDANGLYCKYA
ncbi:hypothetical protein pb186bvf_020648 [Paramecium bursaria]